MTMSKAAIYIVGLLGVLATFVGCSGEVVDEQTSASVQQLCSLQSVIMNPPAPGPVTPGGSVSIQVTASCNVSQTAQYRIRYRLKGAKTWTVLRGWGGPSFTWNTVGFATGLYELRVETRAIGVYPGVESAQIVDYAIGDYCTGATLTSLDPTPQPIGEIADFHATATCLNGKVPEFQYLLRHQGETAFTVAQDWGSSSDFAWDTNGEPVGVHRVQVRVRGVGSASPYEVKQALDHELITCGNSVVDGADQCDGNDFNGQTCATLGFSGGNLFCSAACTVDTTSCVSCNNGTIDPNEDCEDGNLLNGDGCSSTCQFEFTEVEPNEDGTPSIGAGTAAASVGNDFSAVNANGPFDAAGGDQNILASLNPAGDEDVFAVTNTTGGAVDVRFDTWNMALGFGVACGSSIDTVVNIRDVSGNLILQNDDRSGSDLCSGGSFTLAAGQTLYAHVVDFGDNTSIAGYYLQLRFSSGGGCGNGAITGSEQCDDNNLIDGDGCSSTCTVEGLGFESEPNNSTADAAANSVQITGDARIGGSITDVTDEKDFYRVTVPTDSVIRFETFTSDGDCSAGTTTLRLFDASSTQLTVDGGSGIGGCAALVRFLFAGTYYIQVEETGLNASLPFYILDVQFQTNTGSEVEPNDSNLQANGNLGSGDNVFLFADHQLTADVDWYSVTVPAGASIRAEIIEGDAFETCESNEVDSRLQIFDSALVLRELDDDTGRGFCSLIDGTGSSPLDVNAHALAGGTYYIAVDASPLATTTGSQFNYRLQVTVRTP